LLGCDGTVVRLRQTDRRGGDIALALTDIEKLISNRSFERTSFNRVAGTLRSAATIRGTE